MAILCYQSHAKSRTCLSGRLKLSNGKIFILTAVGLLYQLSAAFRVLNRATVNEARGAAASVGGFVIHGFIALITGCNQLYEYGLKMAAF